MTAFNRIYLETSVLIKSNWPRVSAALENLLRLANFLNVKVFLPEAVEIELEEHWKRILKKKYDGIDRNVKDLETYLSDLKTGGGKLALPDKEEALSNYQDRVRQIKEERELTTVPMTPRSVGELYRMAARHEPPFKEEGAGFQDTVIYLSVIDHLKEQPGHIGALVSQDNIFKTKKEEVTRLAQSAGVDVEMYESVDEVNKILRERVRAEIIKEWEQENILAEEALRKRLPDIQGFISENLEVTENEMGFGSRVVEVSGVKVNDLKNVRTPMPLRRKPDEPIKISFEVEMELSVVVENLFSPTSPRRLKVGEQAPRSFATEVLGEVLGRPRLENKVLPWLAEVEAAAPAGEKSYEKLELISVRSKSLNSNVLLDSILNPRQEVPSK